MPNIRSQRISKDEIYIQVSDGREWSITRAQIVSLYQAQTGSAAARKTRTIDALKQQIATAFNGMLEIGDIFPDFDPSDSLKSMILSIGGPAPTGDD